jgi:capsular polysaccharide biosynthesis protein
MPPEPSDHERTRAPNDESEREIDFAGLGRSVARRWWLVLAGVVVGAVLGYLTAVGGDDVYVARTTIYLGTPLSPSGGGQIQSLATNPATVSEIVRSEAVVQDVAAEVGVRPGELRRGITSRAIQAASAAARANQNPLVEISVRGPWREESARAANLLAETVIEEISGYVDVKAESLRDQVENQNRELAQIEGRLERLEATATGPGLSDLERLTLQSLVGFAEQRRGQLVNERTATRQLLTLADTVERSSQVTEARAAPVPARSSRSGVVVGALIGLLAGLAAALLWEPVSRRRTPS